MSAPTTPDQRTQTGQATPQRSAADVFMRRMLRIRDTDKKSLMGAHRAFRASLVISGIRCIITYLLIPIAGPVVSAAGLAVLPISIALNLVAFVTGVVSLRRFWMSDHRSKWMYTWFIAVVFAVIIVTLAFDIAKIVSGA